MNRRMSIVLAISILVLATLACGRGTGEPRKLNLYPSPTVLPTQTAVIVEVTTSPIILVVSATPEPTQTSKFLCVTASEAVYLRPSPEASLYPLDPIASGTQVLDTGTRKGNWAFVQVGENLGWINLEFLGRCK